MCFLNWAPNCLIGYVLLSTVTKRIIVDCPSVQLLISIFRIKFLFCHEHRRYHCRLSYYSSRLWIFLIRAIFISNCSQSNNTQTRSFQCISFPCNPKISEGSAVCPLFALSIKDKSAHSHTATQASSHHPAHSILKWELWHFFEIRMWHVFPPLASAWSG